MFKVLIVDDCAIDIRGLVEHIPWEKLNCTVVATAENGADGVEKALESKPDIIITDISMPILNGIAMTAKLREALPKTYFIFMSCFDEFEYAKSAVQYGVTSYVLKPIDLDEMTKNILAVVSRKENEIKKELEEDNLRAQINENMPILRENFFLSMLYGKLKDKNEIEKRAKFLNIPIDCPYRIILFQIEFDASIRKIDDEYVYVQWITDAIQEHIIKKLCFGYCIDCADGNIALLLPNCLECTEDFIETLTYLQHKLQTGSDVKVAIYISTLQKNLFDLSIEFRNLTKLMREECLVFSGGVIMAENVANVKATTDVAVSDIYDALSNIINDNGSIDEFIENFYSEQDIGNRVLMKCVSFCIINNLSVLLFQRNVNFADIFGSEIAVFEKVLQYNSIVNIKQWMKNVLTITKEYLDEMDRCHGNKTVAKIQEIIQNEYADLQSLGQIASKVYLSAGYANRLFKKHTGKTILEYLLRTRIEAAKNLLKNKELKIYEVGRMTGYLNPTYFNTAFKQYTGITPNEYRNKFG